MEREGTYFLKRAMLGSARGRRTCGETRSTPSWSPRPAAMAAPCGRPQQAAPAQRPYGQPLGSARVSRSDGHASTRTAPQRSNSEQSPREAPSLGFASVGTRSM